MGFIVAITDYGGHTEFLGNGTYQYQGEKYAVFSNGIKDAKRYKSYQTAKNATDNKMKSCCNMFGEIKIIEVEL